MTIDSPDPDRLMAGLLEHAERAADKRVQPYESAAEQAGRLEQSLKNMVRPTLAPLLTGKGGHGGGVRWST